VRGSRITPKLATISKDARRSRLVQGAGGSEGNGERGWAGGGDDNLLTCAQPQMREIPSKCGSCGALFPCLPGVSSTAAKWRPRHCCEGSRAAALPRQSRRSNALLLCIVRARPNQGTGWWRPPRASRGMMRRCDRAATAAPIDDVDDDDATSSPLAPPLFVSALLSAGYRREIRVERPRKGCWEPRLTDKSTDCGEMLVVAVIIILMLSMYSFYFPSFAPSTFMKVAWSLGKSHKQNWICTITYT